eukprot:GHVU01201908.1.p1 GENE.GHVU01201908.1~~GHVU01201908.1.p1  ORF type:complete len:103 (+),score=10.30 GHVU01201908.1:146-454(+)
MSVPRSALSNARGWNGGVDRTGTSAQRPAAGEDSAAENEREDPATRTEAMERESERLAEEASLKFDEEQLEVGRFRGVVVAVLQDLRVVSSLTVIHRGGLRF